jgi:hypothetical protein
MYGACCAGAGSVRSLTIRLNFLDEDLRAAVIGSRNVGGGKEQS